MARSARPRSQSAARPAPATPAPIAELRLAVESRLDQIPLLGLVVRHLATELGWEEKESADLDLAVAEAASNAVRHAYAGEPGHEVTLHFRAFEDRLEVAIGDRGKALPSALLPPRPPVAPTGDVEALAVGGRGLWLIGQVTDGLEYTSGPEGNRLALVKRRSAPSRQAG